jgi:hypothetical protein
MRAAQRQDGAPFSSSGPLLKGSLAERVALSQEERTALEEGWRRRMHWAGAFLLTRGCTSKLGRAVGSQTRGQLAACGVEGAGRFTERLAGLLMQWGAREWEVMVLEVERRRGSAIRVQEMRERMEFPTKRQVADSLQGFLLDRMPPWEREYRRRQWRRAGLT